MSHRNAPLTPTGRLRLARCIVEQNWPLRRAADRYGVSITTAQRWAQRYREYGKDGMVDRSSRPHLCPTQLDRRTERRILGAAGLTTVGTAADRLPVAAEPFHGA
jgi:transposase